jgi:hypothetical protein
VTMDTSASREEKAPPPAGDGASSESSSAKVVQQEQEPEPLHDVNRVTAVKKVVESNGEDEDEQVERFFALLANIQALRNVYGAAISDSGSAECRGRKRAREAESSPWRPAFRMEDFALGHEEEVSAAGKNAKKIMEERTGGGMRSPPGTSTSAVADDGDEEYGAVVEETRPRG